MIEKKGIVERIEDRYAVVSSEDVKPSDNVISSLAVYGRPQLNMNPSDKVTFYALNLVGAKEGDHVEFELPVKKFFDISLFDYVFWFILLISSLNFNYGILAIIFGLILIIKIVKRKDTTFDVEPRIVRIID